MLERASWGEIYSGFSVTRFKRLDEVVTSFRMRGYRVIATDKNGVCPPMSWKVLGKAVSSKALIVLEAHTGGSSSIRAPACTTALSTSYPTKAQKPLGPRKLSTPRWKL